MPPLNSTHIVAPTQAGRRRMRRSDSTDQLISIRRAWVPPTLTKHESLTAMTLQLASQPFVRGDSLILGEQGIPCSQGFCP